MLSFASNYVLWLGAGAIAYAITAGLVAHLFAVYVLSRYPLVEEEPAIDMDMLEAELATISTARREEFAARLQ